MSPQYFQRVIPHQFDSCPDKLILKAYQVKYNPKKMKRSVAGIRGAGSRGIPESGTVSTSALPSLCRLEKEYAAMKSKEMEEQIEIKVSSGGMGQAGAGCPGSPLMRVAPPSMGHTAGCPMASRGDPLAQLPFHSPPGHTE